MLLLCCLHIISLSSSSLSTSIFNSIFSFKLPLHFLYYLCIFLSPLSLPQLPYLFFYYFLILLSLFFYFLTILLTIYFLSLLCHCTISLYFLYHVHSRFLSNFSFNNLLLFPLSTLTLFLTLCLSKVMNIMESILISH